MQLDRDTATLEFSLPQPGHVSLAVFDIAGRRLATLADGFRGAGVYQATRNPGRAGQGVYFYRLITDAGTKTRSVLHIR